MGSMCRKNRSMTVAKLDETGSWTRSLKPWRQLDFPNFSIVHGHDRDSGAVTLLSFSTGKVFDNFDVR